MQLELWKENVGDHAVDEDIVTDNVAKADNWSHWLWLCMGLWIGLRMRGHGIAPERSLVCACPKARASSLATSSFETRLGIGCWVSCCVCSVCGERSEVKGSCEPWALQCIMPMPSGCLRRSSPVKKATVARLATPASKLLGLAPTSSRRLAVSASTVSAARSGSSSRHASHARRSRAHTGKRADAEMAAVVARGRSRSVVAVVLFLSRAQLAFTTTLWMGRHFLLLLRNA